MRVRVRKASDPWGRKEPFGGAVPERQPDYMGRAHVRWFSDVSSLEGLLGLLDAASHEVILRRPDRESDPVDDDGPCDFVLEVYDSYRE